MPDNYYSFSIDKKEKAVHILSKKGLATINYSEEVWEKIVKPFVDDIEMTLSYSDLEVEEKDARK